MVLMMTMTTKMNDFDAYLQCIAALQSMTLIWFFPRIETGLQRMNKIVEEVFCSILPV